MLFLFILLYVVSIGLLILGESLLDSNAIIGALPLAVGIIGVNPAANTRLGQSGDVNSTPSSGVTISVDNKTNYPLATNKKISLKIMALNNSRQKVNDVLGNPVEIRIAVMWKVVDTSKAVFNVDNYKEYLSLQCDSALRNIVRVYPYDVAHGIDTTGDGEPDEGSLRGSSALVAERIRLEIQEMVEMALEKLNERNVVELDEERKAAMVSNLLVVLCGNKDVQPIVNNGSLY